MRIVWDEPKRLANLAKHGLDFEDVDPIFFETAVVRPAKQGRWQAFGSLQGTLVALVFAPLGSEALSLISLRTASAKERKRR